MPKTNFICILTVVLSAAAPAWATPKVCTLDADAWKNARRVNLPPEFGAFYFFKPIPGTPWVSFPNNNESQNVLFNLDTRELKKIPGRTDAIPVVNSGYIGLSYSTMQLYSLEELLASANAVNVPVRWSDPTVSDAYQSFGYLGRSNGRNYYRVLTGRHHGLKIKDFWIDGQGRFGAIGASPLPLCGERPISLPMLSKNGLEFAAADGGSRNTNGVGAPTGTTKIYGFNVKTGQCTVKQDLGFFTEKVDFNYNNDEIAFTVPGMSFVDDAGSVRFDKNRPDNMWEKDAYVYRRSTGELIQITDNAGRRKMMSYPAFMGDGKHVIVLQSAMGPNDPGVSSSGTGGRAPGAESPDTFVIVDITKVHCDAPNPAAKSALARSAKRVTSAQCKKIMTDALKDAGAIGDATTGPMSIDDVLAVCDK
jgi:hypothetical protein